MIATWCYFPGRHSSKQKVNKWIESKKWQKTKQKISQTWVITANSPQCRIKNFLLSNGGSGSNKTLAQWEAANSDRQIRKDLKSLYIVHTTMWKNIAYSLIKKDIPYSSYYWVSAGATDSF
jgi:hypothetical protein